MMNVPNSCERWWYCPCPYALHVWAPVALRHPIASRVIANRSLDPSNGLRGCSSLSQHDVGIYAPSSPRPRGAASSSCRMPLGGGAARTHAVSTLTHVETRRHGRPVDERNRRGIQSVQESSFVHIRSKTHTIPLITHTGPAARRIEQRFPERASSSASGSGELGAGCAFIHPTGSGGDGVGVPSVAAATTATAAHHTYARHEHPPPPRSLSARPLGNAQLPRTVGHSTRRRQAHANPPPGPTLSE